MMRKAWLAVVLALVACYQPPAEPEPGRILLEPLLPTPLLDPVIAACTAARIAADAGSASRRLDRTVRKVDGYYAGWSRYRYWWSEDYEASYDAAQAAARATSPAAAALRAAGRVSAHAESAADYADLAAAHASAFTAADRGKEHARRSAAGTLRAMTHGQPDLEALYQQEFERRYGNESCAPASSGPREESRPAAQRTPGVPVLSGKLLPLLSTPLLKPARAACAAGIVAQRAAADWRLIYARQTAADSAGATAAPAAAPSHEWSDWRAARAFADLAALHAGIFALDAGTSEQGAAADLESRIRRIARQTPGLEKAYQDEFAPAYSGPTCLAR